MSELIEIIIGIIIGIFVSTLFYLWRIYKILEKGGYFIE